eukprot:4171362-Pleurochrysis_carterae.AAC.1
MAAAGEGGGTVGAAWCKSCRRERRFSRRSSEASLASSSKHGCRTSRDGERVRSLPSARPAERGRADSVCGVARLVRVPPLPRRHGDAAGIPAAHTLCRHR